MIRLDYSNGGSTWTPFFDTSADDASKMLMSAKLVQSANSIGSLTMQLPVDNVGSDSISNNTLVRAYNTETSLYEFFGRVIVANPSEKMDKDGKKYKEVVCESAEGFLKDTVVQLDATKSWWNSSSIDIDEDGTRTLSAYSLLSHAISQHNATVGDTWKAVSMGYTDIDLDNVNTNPVSVSADWESTTFDIVQAIADECNCEWMLAYSGGANCSIQMRSKFYSNTSGTFEVGDNLASNALEESIAEVATRTFPYGETYTKLKKTVCTATESSYVLDGTKVVTGKGTMCRFNVEDAIKVTLVIGKRDNDYAMVFFTEDTIASLKDKDNKISVLKKYQTKRDTGTNLTKHYPVPSKAKYVYVFGSVASGTKCTKYENYTVGSGDDKVVVKNDYKVGLRFWMDMLDSSYMDTWTGKYGLTVGTTTDDEGDTLKYLALNEDKYGSIECAEIKDNLLAVKKITDSKKAVYSLSDLVKKSDGTYKASAVKKAKRFFKWACRRAAANATSDFTLKLGAYDLKAAGLNYNALKLYQNWRVTNDLCGLDAIAEVVRVKRDLLKPWDVDVEMGSKVTKASGAGGKGGKELDESAAPTMDGHEGDDSVDSAATAAEEAAAQAAKEAAEKASVDASEAIEHADKAKALAEESTALSTESYDTVFPITDAMRKKLDEAFTKADLDTAIEEELSFTYDNADGLAKAKAEYTYSESKSAARYSRTYEEVSDVWASDDESVQAQIKYSVGLLYGYENATSSTAGADRKALKNGNTYSFSNSQYVVYGTAENPKSNSAQSKYVDALGEEIQAEEKYASSLVDLAVANRILANRTAQYGEASEEVAAAQELVSEAHDRIYGVGGTAANPTEGGSLYALNVARAALDSADAEVDTALNGIHSTYKSSVEQTARSLTTSVESLKSATHMVQTDTGWTWEIEDTTARAAAGGKKVSAVSVEYQMSSDGDEVPSGTWRATPYYAYYYGSGRYIWAKATVSFDGGYDSEVCYAVLDRASSSVSSSYSSVPSYAKANSSSTRPTSGWSSSTSELDSLKAYLWIRFPVYLGSTPSYCYATLFTGLSDATEKAYMSFEGAGGNGVLSIGGNSSTITMGGSSSTLNLCGNDGRIQMAAEGGNYSTTRNLLIKTSCTSSDMIYSSIRLLASEEYGTYSNSSQIKLAVVGPTMNACSSVVAIDGDIVTVNERSVVTAEVDSSGNVTLYLN